MEERLQSARAWQRTHNWCAACFFWVALRCDDARRAVIAAALGAHGLRRRCDRLHHPRARDEHARKKLHVALFSGLK